MYSNYTPTAHLQVLLSPFFAKCPGTIVTGRDKTGPLGLSGTSFPIRRLAVKLAARGFREGSIGKFETAVYF